MTSRSAVIVLNVIRLKFGRLYRLISVANPVIMDLKMEKFKKWRKSGTRIPNTGFFTSIARMLTRRLQRGALRLWISLCTDRNVKSTQKVRDNTISILTLFWTPYAMFFHRFAHINQHVKRISWKSISIIFVYMMTSYNVYLCIMTSLKVDSVSKILYIVICKMKSYFEWNVFMC